MTVFSEFFDCNISNAEELTRIAWGHQNAKAHLLAAGLMTIEDYNAYDRAGAEEIRRILSMWSVKNG